MILSCPSCGTLYRFAGGPPALRARCACCDGAVPVAARRQYAVHAVPRSDTLVASADWPRHALPFRAGRRPAATAALPSAPPIGMDEPGLAARLQHADAEGAAHASAPGGAMTWTLRTEEGAPPAIPAAPADTTGSESGRGTIVPRPRERRLGGMIVGVAAGALAGFAGASWFGGSAVGWWAGGALVGAAVALVATWTSRTR